MSTSQNTIVALSTPQGTSGIAVIRLSGEDAFAIIDKVFVGKIISEQPSHTLHFGKIVDDEKLLDEVVISIFKNPHSYNGEDTVEISCHGSMFIIQKIISLLVQSGARIASPGEFTKRAFMNGKLDLSQAEAVADIIASENESQHKMAIQQMRGGYSEKISGLRQELIDFAALIELELDFSEEDIEFADRKKFYELVDQTLDILDHLIDSFQLGNVIKKGIPIAIVGKPNVGKSTLLNRLLNEEKAIVSEIAGTTRDFIEDTLQLKGMTYRFVDTAGIRETTDILESKGIERSYEKIKQAEIIFYLADITEPLDKIVDDFNSIEFTPDQKVIILLNKSDELDNFCNAYDIEEAIATLTRKTTLEISAKQNRNLDKLISILEDTVGTKHQSFDFIVSNARHLQAFQDAKNSLEQVKQGLNNRISGEFISIDIRAALHALGTVTGEISNEDVLSSVFSRFCIGK
ncbi:MAG TPA: tRNA uridine-5-carboxymethylaminomethyl(34) synthesis GTPase MnmE [Chitinophagaceae bacterium]|nr:tRNA uridine-5-carboxymethylaminomethyl(34) synthesis GTPase MnmE [Chitinophagaceae bacterium]